MSNNPLQQYFRRPTIYFSLPSGGKFYGPEVVNFPANKELPVYPMTSLDEIAIRTPDGLFNGSSVVDVIKSCIPAIVDPWKLNSIDMEAVMVAIRAASVDGKMEIISTCPSCSEESKYDIDLLKLLVEKVDVDYGPLVLGELTVNFRPLTYAETNENSKKQFEIQRLMATMEDYEDNQEKQNVIKQSMDRMNHLFNDIVTQMIDSVITPETTVTDKEHIREFVVMSDGKTNKLIKEKSTALRQANDTKPLKIRCINCQHEYKQGLVLNFTDFFE